MPVEPRLESLLSRPITQTGEGHRLWRLEDDGSRIVAGPHLYSQLALYFRNGSKLILAGADYADGLRGQAANLIL